MKKIVILVLLVLGLVGCSSSETNNGLNLTSVKKAEVVVKLEYISRLERLFEEATSQNLDEKYKDSENTSEALHGEERDEYKVIVEGLTTFRTDNEEINVLHDKLIEVTKDIYDLHSTIIEQEQESLDMNSKEEHLRNCLEIYENRKKLEDMIDNQIEHEGNIAKEIYEKIGVEW